MTIKFEFAQSSVEKVSSLYSLSDLRKLIDELEECAFHRVICQHPDLGFFTYDVRYINFFDDDVLLTGTGSAFTLPYPHFCSLMRNNFTSYKSASFNLLFQ